MHETVAKVVSRQVADELGTCWGLGSGTRNDPGPWHGELRNMYKPVTQPNMWLQGGNLALSRFFSKFVALQIKARMEGLRRRCMGEPAYKADDEGRERSSPNRWVGICVGRTEPPCQPPRLPFTPKSITRTRRLPVPKASRCRRRPIIERLRLPARRSNTSLESAKRAASTMPSW